MRRPAKLAKPAASVETALPPVSVPVPTRASETGVPATPLPNASETLSWTAGVIAAPAVTFVGWTTKASDAAAAGETVNAALVAWGSVPLEAVSCLPPPRSMLRPENVTMPLASVDAAPPPVSVPPPTRPRDTRTPGVPLPNASDTWTCTAGAIAPPATTSDGCAANASEAAAAGETVNAALVTLGSAPLEAASCLLPATSMLNAGKLARPPASLTVAAPPVSVPVPASASDTDAPATAFPNASATRTRTGGEIVTPATASDGGAKNAREAAAAEDTPKEALVTLGNAPLDAVSCLLPATSTLNPENVAIPPASVEAAPPPVSVPAPTRASETEVPGTPLPNASPTLTCTAGAIATPATAFVGWTTKASVDAAAGETVNVALVVLGAAPHAAVSCLLPARSMLRPAKLAMPDAFVATPAPPVSVPVPTSASATLAPGTGLVNASSACTWTAGATLTPATTLVG